MEFYVGTFASNEKSVYKCVVDKEGKINADPCITAGPKPSFIRFNKDKTYLYAVNELDPSEDGAYGSIVCLRKESDGSYQYCKSLSTNGYYPCNISLSIDEKFLFVTNYVSGNFCVYSLLNGYLGSLVQECTYEGSSVDPARQEASHPHGSICSLDGKYLYVTDLGCDYIYVYSINNQEKQPLILIDKIKTPEGTGPRHLSFSDDGTHLYVAGELADCVLVYAYNQSTGMIDLLQNIPVYEGRDAQSRPMSKEIIFHKLSAEIAYYKGRVYLSNRYTGEKEDTISIFKVLPDAKLELIKSVPCGGKTPRYFKIFPQMLPNNEDALVVVSLDTNNAAVFRMEEDGLEKLYTIPDIPLPSCVI